MRPHIRRRLDHMPDDGVNLQATRRIDGGYLDDAGTPEPKKKIEMHGGATCEYAYGPAQGLPPTGVGTFTQALYDEAKRQGWVVISMKGDWRRIVAFEP